MSDQPPVFLSKDLPPLNLAIVASLYNQSWVDALLDRVGQVLADYGQAVEPASICRVPGAMELPFGVEHLYRKRQDWHGFLVLGLVLAGQTQHHTLISQSTAYAFHSFTARTGLPVINGILVVDSAEQAESRISGPLDRGKEFASALVQVAALQ